MSTKTKTITEMNAAELRAAYDHSWYTITGVGGNPDEWVEGYEGMLTEEGIEKPEFWATTTGAFVNQFAGKFLPFEIQKDDRFPDDVTFLMFPLTGLDLGKLAMFKLRMEDRWFDDIIGNIRSI